MTEDRLLTEIQRQKKYTDALGKDFAFPLFNSRKALESQRQSGYRNSAAAAREIVDNAIEAGAGKVHVVFARPTDKKKHERSDHVEAVAFIDNGSGMIPLMARYALSWGGGTHFDDPGFIGRFGFGLPNASINQTKRVEVYTRVAETARFTRAWLDINDYTGEGAVQQIQPTTEADLPQFVEEYCKRNAFDLSHGTVVVWCNPDRLSYKTGAALRSHLLDDFGATYRYLLKDFELVVEGTTVQMVDPMFLDPKGRFFVEEEKGGARKQHDEAISVVLTMDPVTGEKHLKKVGAPEDLNQPNIVAAGGIHVRVSRFPLGFIVGRKFKKKGVPPLDEDSANRFEIRKSRRGMSFVRAGREIETVDAFPRRASDEASGLGDWPLLQGYAYHSAIEVKFNPQLDDVFGITNDKQAVRPIEDFWRLLASEGIDQLLHRELRWQEDERRVARNERNKASLERNEDEPSRAELAAQAADVAIGDNPSVPDTKKPDAAVALEKQAEKEVGKGGQGETKHSKMQVKEAREALEAQLKRRPYRVEFVDDANGPFYAPEWVGTQVVVRVNKKHPFFTTLYGTLLDMVGGKLAMEAVDLLLIALARSELTATNPETIEFYRAQRVEKWSPFLGTAMRTLQRDFPTDAEEDEEAA